MTPRTVLITGCSTGIGRACAERLARSGHTVYATARRLESIEDLVAAGWGRVVNMSSMGGNFTFPGAGAYHASKYAVEAISDALRFEVKGFGVGVTVIQPGADPHARDAVGARARDPAEADARPGLGRLPEHPVQAPALLMRLGRAAERG